MNLIKNIKAFHGTGNPQIDAFLEDMLQILFYVFAWPFIALSILSAFPFLMAYFLYQGFKDEDYR